MSDQASILGRMVIVEHIQRAGRAVQVACFEAVRSCPESQVADVLAEASSVVDDARDAARLGDRDGAAASLAAAERMLRTVLDVCEWRVSSAIEAALARVVALREVLLSELAAPA